MILEICFDVDFLDRIVCINISSLFALGWYVVVVWTNRVISISISISIIISHSVFANARIELTLFAAKHKSTIPRDKNTALTVMMMVAVGDTAQKMRPPEKTIMPEWGRIMSRGRCFVCHARKCKRFEFDDKRLGMEKRTLCEYKYVNLHVLRSESEVPSTFRQIESVFPKADHHLRVCQS